MTLSGIHILLTYACNYECDHCFLYCGPKAEGTFTMAGIRRVLDQAKEARTVSSIYIEGGEPFLYYPVLVESLAISRDMGFRTGLVTNCYWATSVEDAELWLKPIAKNGIDDLSVSDDGFHSEEESESPARRVAKAAGRLGLPATSICIEKPLVQAPQEGKGQAVVGGGALLRGRAAETLTEGLPKRPIDSFSTCPHEELVSPERVHVDPFGHVHVCQGISMGNLRETPLVQMMAKYDAEAHPICGPLVRGGPKALAEAYDVKLDGDFVDECHYCFAVRRALVDRFDEVLAPRQVYGMEEERK